MQAVNPGIGVEHHLLCVRKRGHFGWSEGGRPPDPRTVSSAGLGLRWDPHAKIRSGLYWGFAFRNVNTSEQGLQDDGIHFSMDVGLF